ncbi:hypothetical protein RVS70_05875 [Virgibacillus sp. M23]|uniref:hypothetical protein n=1 Tax=Virgibacillus sp. M23 TaxID=3079030 RepID=UPI002A90CDDC|nr:hypothetical protein [Virgibacillus sp. M23]MDY7043730.1 hypothetical protein [Virgibacillus sp. M23]
MQMITTVKVANKGNLEDYKKIPLTHDGKPIGFVLNAEDKGDYYELTLSVKPFVNVEFLYDGTPYRLEIN